MQTIRGYAHSTENRHLLNLLDKLRDAALARHDPNRPRPVRPVRQPKPKLPPDEQDYRSIVQVIERMGQRVTT